MLVKGATAHFNIAMAEKIFIVGDDIFKSISLYANGFSVWSVQIIHPVIHILM